MPNPIVRVGTQILIIGKNATITTMISLISKLN
jgi:hypothetical protein